MRLSKQLASDKAAAHAWHASVRQSTSFDPETGHLPKSWKLPTSRTSPYMSAIDALTVHNIKQSVELPPQAWLEPEPHTIPDLKAPPHPLLSASSSVILYLSPSGSDSSTCGTSSATACSTFGHSAVRCANISCSVISAAVGTYTGPGNINLDWDLPSDTGPIAIIASTPQSVIIDCNSNAGWTFWGGNYTVYGVSFQNCASPGLYVEHEPLSLPGSLFLMGAAIGAMTPKYLSIQYSTFSNSFNTTAIGVISNNSVVEIDHCYLSQTVAGAIFAYSLKHSELDSIRIHATHVFNATLLDPNIIGGAFSGKVGKPAGTTEIQGFAYTDISDSSFTADDNQLDPTQSGSCFDYAVPPLISSSFSQIIVFVRPFSRTNITDTSVWLHSGSTFPNFPAAVNIMCAQTHLVPGYESQTIVNIERVNTTSFQGLATGFTLPQCSNALVTVDSFSADSTTWPMHIYAAAPATNIQHVFSNIDFSNAAGTLQNGVPMVSCAVNADSTCSFTNTRLIGFDSQSFRRLRLDMEIYGDLHQSQAPNALVVSNYFCQGNYMVVNGAECMYVNGDPAYFPQTVVNDMNCQFNGGVMSGCIEITIANTLFVNGGIFSTNQMQSNGPIWIQGQGVFDGISCTDNVTPNWQANGLGGCANILPIGIDTHMYITMINSEIARNFANTGGAIWVYSPSNLYMGFNVFRVLSNNTFDSNYAGAVGGAVGVAQFGEIRIDVGAENVVFRNNTACCGGIGGALYNDGTLTVFSPTGMSVIDNSASTGGALALTLVAPTSVPIAYCINNTATSGGGLVFWLLTDPDPRPLCAFSSGNSGTLFGNFQSSFPAYLSLVRTTPFNDNMSYPIPPPPPPIVVYPGQSFVTTAYFLDAYNQTMVSFQDQLMFDVSLSNYSSNFIRPALTQFRFPAFFGGVSVGQYPVAVTEYPATFQLTISTFAPSSITPTFVSIPNYIPAPIQVEYVVGACPPGTYFSPSSHQCANCSFGTYAISAAQAQCYPCCDNCVCSPSTVTADDGYWISFDSEGIASAFPCPLGFCVAGGCGPHRNISSPLCAQCEEGYSNWNGNCLKCDGVDTGLVVALVIVFFLYTVIQHLLFQTVPGVVKIVILHFQLLALFQVLHPITTAEHWVTSVTSVMNLKINVVFGTVDATTCPFPLTPYLAFLLVMVVPIAMIPTLLIMSLSVRTFHRLCRSKKEGHPDDPHSVAVSPVPHPAAADESEIDEDGIPSPKKKPMRPLVIPPNNAPDIAQPAVPQISIVDRLFSSTALGRSSFGVLLFAFQNWIVCTFYYFDCVQIGDKKVMTTSPDVDCDSDTYQKYLPAFRFFAVLLAVTPCVVAYLFWRYRKPIMLQARKLDRRTRKGQRNVIVDVLPQPGDSKFLMALGVLFEGYKKPYFWFELIHLIERLAFIGFAALCSHVWPEYPSRRFVMLIFVILVAYSIHVYCHPWRTNLDNRVQTFSFFSLIALCVLMMYQEAISGRVESDSTVQNAVIACIAVPILIFLLLWLRQILLLLLALTSHTNRCMSGLRKLFRSEAKDNVQPVQRAE